MAPSFPSLNDMTNSEIRAELEHHEKTNNFHRPTRSTIDPARPWLFGIPNYDKADLLYFRGRTTFHAKDSLEDVVENAVKTWEMEASHLSFSDWQSVDHHSYTVSANGGKRFEGEEGAVAGNYNWLLENCDKSFYDSEKETFDSSHELFRGAFLHGFPWELLKVFSGPPKIAFSWRHWGLFNGSYKGKDGDGDVYDMYGWGVVTVNEELKIKEIEIFYKPDEFLKAMEGGGDKQVLKRGQTVIGSGCPFLAAKGEAN